MPSVNDYRGNLSFAEGGRHVPFDIRRVYYLYDIPSGAERAGHAHRELTQVFIALSGRFDLVLDDGLRQETVHLSRAHMVFVIIPFVWRVLNNFSGSSVCLVLPSTDYDAGDYICDYGIGPGDEVIVPIQTFIATWLAVSACGAIPVAADIDLQIFSSTQTRILVPLVMAVRSPLMTPNWRGESGTFAITVQMSNTCMRKQEPIQGWMNFKPPSCR